uniref:ATP synthase complex subunit 8 n=1 Tax=Tinda javana TaxID=931524 RepID=A0A7S8FIS0_9DIPT|nr:ATP synthase F0 subunit 8 [Tinda javana]QPD06984.1 ATP synthase F0 subunit 8 [Tinda javana]
MPQMAPINWLMLFIIFSVTFIMFNVMNYYCFFNKIPQSSKSEKKTSSSLNWKW